MSLLLLSVVVLQAADPCINIMYTYTEEGKKVERNAGPKLASVFVRRSDAEALAVEATRDFWEPLSSVAAFRAGAPELAGVAGAGAGKA